jgi:hypothetical protein
MEVYVAGGLYVSLLQLKDELYPEFFMWVMRPFFAVLVLYYYYCFTQVILMVSRAGSLKKVPQIMCAVIEF